MGCRGAVGPPQIFSRCKLLGGILLAMHIFKHVTLIGCYGNFAPLKFWFWLRAWIARVIFLAPPNKHNTSEKKKRYNTTLGHKACHGKSLVNGYMFTVNASSLNIASHALEYILEKLYTTVITINSQEAGQILWSEDVMVNELH